MGRYKARSITINNNKPSVLNIYNNITIKSAITDLTKSGLVLWLYFAAAHPGDNIIINQAQLKAAWGITENMISRGLLELEEKHYLVDGVFYEQPYVESNTTERWANIF